MIIIGLICTELQEQKSCPQCTGVQEESTISNYNAEMWSARNKQMQEVQQQMSSPVCIEEAQAAPLAASPWCTLVVPVYKKYKCRVESLVFKEKWGDQVMMRWDTKQVSIRIHDAQVYKRYNNKCPVHGSLAQIFLIKKGSQPTHICFRKLRRSAWHM